MTHLELLARAIDLAVKHAPAGTCGPFGAVIARDGEIIAEGWNCVVERNDPCAHAEIVAIREACRQLQTHELSGCLLYASCEPCPMCLAAIYWAHLGGVYFAATAQDAEAAGFDDRRIAAELRLEAPQRNLAYRHLPIDNADAPFSIWLANRARVPY